jgi:hypothetical protein
MGGVTTSAAGSGRDRGARPASRAPTVVGRDPRRPFAVSPFARLARTHAAGIGGDALFAIALAGSVFFSLDFDSARWRVALYLVLTIAPFAVAAPLLGPALDRLKGGRRWVVVGSMALRAVLAFFVIRHLDAIWFYPEAFLMLVLAKVYSISKSALVPTTVRSDDELVEANSKLAVLSAVAVVAVVPFGGLALHFGGPGWVLVLAMGMFALATGLALQLPPATVADQPAGEQERAELRSAGIFLAASAMGLVRGIVGFLTFMLAFAFKEDGAPLWHLGVAAAAAQVGVFAGALVAPHLRRITSEEKILTGCLAVVVAGGLVCAVLGGLAGAAILSLLVGLAANASKQAFDSIVQRDAPDANRGRSFARFETRFQLFWVFGALLPIVIPIPAPVGFLVVAIVAGFAGVSYYLGQSQVRKGTVPVRKRRLPVPRQLSRFSKAGRAERRAGDAGPDAEGPGGDAGGGLAGRGDAGGEGPGGGEPGGDPAGVSVGASDVPPPAPPAPRPPPPPPPPPLARSGAGGDGGSGRRVPPSMLSPRATAVVAAPRAPRPTDPTVVEEATSPLFDGEEFFEEHVDVDPGPSPGPGDDPTEVVPTAVDDPTDVVPTVVDDPTDVVPRVDDPGSAGPEPLWRDR